MIYCVDVKIKFSEEPLPTRFELFSKQLQLQLEEYTKSAAGFVVEHPAAKVFEYSFEINSKNKLSAKELYQSIKVDEDVQITYVTITERRFDERCTSNVGYWWTNEGETWYHDSENSYVDPYYRFIVNGQEEYSVVHIPTYINRFDERDRKHYEESGATYMWRCTSCWDNWMKATTIDEAIDEFENIYKKKLWSSVEGYKRELNKAVDNFAAFDEYLWNKRW